MPADGDAPGWPAGFVASGADRRALLALLAVPGLTPRRLLRLAGTEGSASACLAAVREGRVGHEPGALARGPDRAAASRVDARTPGGIDVEAARAIDPVSIEAALAACGARMAPVGSAEYPSRLGDLADPPASLFLRGRPLEPEEVRVAMVGARNCSPLGSEVAQAVGRGLAEAGVCVVSGAARGIDAASHLGAIAADGPTVAVLGCGIDTAYPPQHGNLLERIASVGTVVTEYPPGVPAQAFRFPARNRIVAALADAVVVVEGAAGSGSLITADHALDLGRPVYAVPGPVTSPLSEVPLALIRDGATMIRGAADLLSDLGIEGRAGPAPGPGGVEGGSPAGDGAGELEDVVLAMLNGPTLPEQLAREIGRELSEVVRVLMELELRGLVRNVGGRVERRLPGGD